MLLYKLNDLVKMKKAHPCGSDEFKIIAMDGAVTLKCSKCDRVIEFTKEDFEKYVRKIYRGGKFISIR
ncbi:DUF951 domain-containing protein [uncultured Fenollaria sp.]|uniref:DUF951 domain-containing protein n=1 Tax=uncultured Fenollaria sp. TaxID=1686315 RepID=UPI0025E8C35B|nr:DUF951 domain-containing protein [uncultured Fenollaria sp.]